MSGFSTTDEAQNEPRQGMLLPVGGYRCIVNKCDVKRSKNDINSQYVEVEFGFLPYIGTGDNPIAKRKHWERFTIQNPNPEAMRIGRSQFADFLEACAGKEVKLTDIKQAEQACPGKEIFIEVYHQKRKDNGELQVRCGGFWAKGGHMRGKEKRPLPVPSKAYSAQPHSSEAHSYASHEDQDTPF